MSRPALLGEVHALGEALHEPGDADLVDHLGQLARRRTGPSGRQARAKLMITGSARAKASASPPHITVSTPFSAPAWPPETGASTKAKPLPRPPRRRVRARLRRRPSCCRRRRRPCAMPAKAPSGPSVTERRSSSLPTQENTKSWPLGGLRGRPARPPPCSDDPLLGLGEGAVVDGDVVPLGREMAGHGIAHDAETEESDFRHVAMLLLRMGPAARRRRSPRDAQACAGDAASAAVRPGPRRGGSPRRCTDRAARRRGTPTDRRSARRRGASCPSGRRP